MTERPRVRGLNHLTLAVADLDRSVAFYRDRLGFEVAMLSLDTAYLDAGSLWLCLSRDAETRRAAHPDYTHIAFDVAAEDFAVLAARVRAVAPVWRENRSEGASIYFLDPDGHKLELHVGALASRLAHYRAKPTPGRFIRS